MQVHHRRVAPGQDQADGLAFLGADGAEDIGGSGALIGGSGGAAAAPRPAAGALVLLTDPGLVAKPNLYVAGIEAMLARDRRQYRRPVFLK
jgi:hypothetical protein